MNEIKPLKPQFRLDEDAGFIPDQIKDRVQSEDLYTWAKGYSLIKVEDIWGRAGEPLKV